MAQSEYQIFEIHSSSICPLDLHMPGSNTHYIDVIMMLGQEKCTSMSKSKRSRLVWALIKLHQASLLKSFKIAAKANGLGWRHGTMILSAQLGGIHFTDACACSGAIKMKW